jgi:mRNA interferase RelE/StbE
LAYRLGFKKSVQRDLKHLSKPEAKRILDQIEKELLKAPETHPVLKGMFTGLRKYRVGDYRIIYTIVGTEVRILRIGHRSDVYKREI